jgi:LPXTG-site transpeptidase (sortase) family protein
MVSLPLSLEYEMTLSKRIIGLVLLGFGLAAVVVASLSLLADDSTSGNPAEIEEALRPEDPGPVELGPQPTTTPAPTDDAETDTAADDPVAPVPVTAPVGLRIDKLEVDAPVDPYGVDQGTGQMAVPDNVTDVAWYQFGPRPGEPGSAVLAAHVDLAGSGPGVFFELDTLEEGDRVTVLHDDGSESSYRVVARITYEKDELPLDVIFARQGPPVLTLITCGGAFNRNISRYDSNIVVYAVPDLGGTPVEGSSV